MKISEPASEAKKRMVLPGEHDFTVIITNNQWVMFWNFLLAIATTFDQSIAMHIHRIGGDFEVQIEMREWLDDFAKNL